MGIRIIRKFKLNEAGSLVGLGKYILRCWSWWIIRDLVVKGDGWVSIEQRWCVCVCGICNVIRHPCMHQLGDKVDRGKRICLWAQRQYQIRVCVGSLGVVGRGISMITCWLSGWNEHQGTRSMGAPGVSVNNVVTKLDVNKKVGLEG